MVCIRIQADIRAVRIGLATARTQNLDLDRTSIWLVPNSNALSGLCHLGQAHKKGLEGIGVRSAVGGVTEPCRAVGSENRSVVKV